MRLVTIQNKKVLDILKNGKIYTADFDHIFKLEKNEPVKFMSYQVLMECYGYKHPPIFCCILDRKSTFNETKVSKNRVIIELEVLDTLVNVHNINVWNNMQYCIDRGIWTEETYERYKPYLLNGNLRDIGAIVQSTIPYINPKWIVGAYELPRNFIKKFNPYYILQNISYNKSIPLYEPFRGDL